MNYAVVIPSKTAENVAACIGSIWAHDPIRARRVIVVDDGVDWKRVSDSIDLVHIVGISGISVLPGEKPFVFARNCNIGIRRALEDGADGVILMNDDAQLKTVRGFLNLASVAEAHPEYGVIAAATDSVGNPNQFNRGGSLRSEPRMVCFICVYIPKTTIEKVGYLDERYVYYGLDDDDYCFMVREERLKLGVFDGCFVDHTSLKSSYRGDPRTPSDFRQNMQIFIDKWGTDNWGLPAEQARKKWAVPA